MHRIVRKPSYVAVILTAVLLAVGVGASRASTASKQTDSRYTVHALVSDQPGQADHTDPNLVNAWGIAASSSSPWWVANNGTETSTLYDGDGVAQFPPTPLVVGVPGNPTGIVFNGNASDFVIDDGLGDSGSARFLFATEGGTIRGWSPAVPPPPISTQTFVGPNDADQSGAGAIFKGLAILSDRLYATDFGNGKVDVFDSGFHLAPGGFVDPKVPRSYSPFGIQAIGDNIIVTYAKKLPGNDDETDGPGLGIVDEYSADGVLLARVGQYTTLNAPWGIAMAPSNFGDASGDLLIGNFGDGRISVFEPGQLNGTPTFEPKGQLLNTRGHKLSVDGLWGIGFGNGSGSGATNALYFAAGPDDESHGLFGRIEVAPNS